MDVGKVLNRTIAVNQDGEKKVLLLEVEVSEEDDAQEIELQISGGDDYNPPDGSRVFISKVSDSYLVSNAIDDGIEPDESIEQGEREIYSVTGEEGELERAAKIRWKKDGSLVLNDGTDYAILYTEMKKAFDQLKADHDALVVAFNGFIPHVHNIIKPLPGEPVTPAAYSPSKPSTADMSPSKVEKVRI